jgi:hypothetical protein
LCMAGDKLCRTGSPSTATRPLAPLMLDRRRQRS